MKKPPNSSPAAAEVNALRTWLKANGLSNAQANDLIKATRTRRQNVIALAAHLKTITKGSAR